MAKLTLAGSQQLVIGKEMRVCAGVQEKAQAVVQPPERGLSLNPGEVSALSVSGHNSCFKSF